MDAPSRAFSFVDRIASLQPGVRIAGSYAIPSTIDVFPSSLVAESVGQLAAWAAMAVGNFARRPVAGLAGNIELLVPVFPGQTLQLEAELESVDDEAVSYGGTARVDGIPVIRLERCVGPMLPQEEFADPEALRDRFALLCGAGAAPGGFKGMPALFLDRTGGETGRTARANLQVPAAASFFADHFPRRSVFPGTLLMHLNLQLIAALATEIAPPTNQRRWTLATVSDVKLRAFIPPGEMLELEATLTENSDEHATFAVETFMGKRKVGGARVRLTPEKHS